MTMTSRRSAQSLTLTLFTGLAFVAACGSERLASPSGQMQPADATASHGGSGPGGGSGSTSPQFLTADSGAPAMANPFIAFWAKKGRDTTVFMYYHARPRHHDSTTFMEFRVRDRSLLSRPNGSLFASGDSVLITVTLADPVKLRLDFQPSGLQFSSHDSAELKMNFSETAPVRGRDPRTLDIWRKESATDPWLPLSSIVSSGSKDVQTKIGGFTGYAMAY